MQAVILAAGKSTRTYPLTITKPKPLLKAANKTLLEHNLDNLDNLVDEAIIVVGYKKGMIKKHIGSRYKNIKITYVEQKEQSGTGNALLLVEKYIKNHFISLHGDDVYSRKDLKNIAGSKYQYSILIKKIKNPKLFGVILQKNNILVDLIEKSQKFVSNLANTGLYKLDKKIFNSLKKTRKSARNEYDLTDAIKDLSKNEKIHCVASQQWLPIGYPWDLLKADKILRKGKNIIGNNSKIHGKVRSSSIGENCAINGNVENSIVMDNATIGKGSVVRDSVIGDNVYFKGKILSKNNALSITKNKKIKAGRLGAIIADNANAKNVVIEPGCKIWPNKSISNTTIRKDIQ